MSSSTPLRLFSTATGLRLEHGAEHFIPNPALTLDAVFRAADPVALVRQTLQSSTPANAVAHPALRAPIQSQEVWAAGVTYLRSKSARMDESKDAGGGSFYDRVYDAPRPELFFKATPHRVAAPGTAVRIRADGR